MTSCWETNPKDMRFSFSDLVMQLSDLVDLPIMSTSISEEMFESTAL